jgi:hypothetical protein
MITENGYYKIKVLGRWGIGLYVRNEKGEEIWILPGHIPFFGSSNFDEIDPQRIIMPDEKEVNNE